MNQDLRIALDTLVKLLICHFSIVDTNLMADHEARLGLPSDDKVSQISVVLFDVALASRQLQSLCRVSLRFQPLWAATYFLEQLAKAQAQHTLAAG